MQKIFVLLLCLTMAVVARTQQIESAYSVYEELLLSRNQRTSGESGAALFAMLKRYRNASSFSSETFAADLARLFSAKKNIGILYFTFEQDVLTRRFFIPGKLIEERKITVTLAELTGFSVQLNRALDLYRLTANRSAQRRGLGVENDSAGVAVQYDTLVNRLTSLLLPQAFDTTYRHLIIIPCLNLGALPFQLLTPYRDSSALIDRASITMAPNMIDLIALRSKLLNQYLPSGNAYLVPFDELDAGETAKLQLLSWKFERPLFVANPTYPSHPRFYFPNLPGAENEVANAVKQLRQYVLLRGDSAVKSEVFKNISSADLAYFATHGVSDIINPWTNNFLVLSGADPFLTSREIFEWGRNRNYRAPEMVVLSACQTGLGQTMAGGLMGSLSRSFLMSGSSFVVESLWSVDDEATAYLMTRFMTHLQKPLPNFPAEPLRLAILDTKKKYKAPVYWAGFSLMGTNF